jgi:hypothetical protein
MIVSCLCMEVATKTTKALKAYLAWIGSRGGKKSRRTLDPAAARRMVALREARKAYRDFSLECFWSYKPNARIEFETIPLVLSGLKTEGDKRAFERARRIERLLVN